MRSPLLPIIVVVALSGLASVALSAEIPEPVFYLPLDGNTTAPIAGGVATPRLAGHEDPILTLIDLRAERFGPGRVGQCYDAGESPLVFRCAGNFRPDEGTCAFWLSPKFRGDDTNLYCTFFGAADWGMLYKYRDQTGLTFGTAKPDRDIYYDCGVPDISDWRPGQWHHLVVSWSRTQDERRIYVDGELKATAPFPFHRAVEDGPLFIGAGCTLYPGHVAHSLLDEVAIWDHPLDEAAVGELFALGEAGEPIRQVTARDPEAGQTLVIPDLGGSGSLQVVQETATRQSIALDDWWHFRPAIGVAAELPIDGWGKSRVPGYWTLEADTRTPADEPPQGQWLGRPLAEYPVAYYHRTFALPTAWEERAVFLHLGGVDGLAEVFFNGVSLGWLPGWEREAYEIGSDLEYGANNSLTIALHTRGDSTAAGIYGGVRLVSIPDAFIDGIAVHPKVADGRIEFSLDVWSDAPCEPTIELEIAPSTSPNDIVRRFTHAVTLNAADRSSPELSAQVKRVECSFDWDDAHAWTLDDPFLYNLVARVRIGDVVVDESATTTFGFREFTVRGADFILNGKPTHLRGHQIDLGWSDQMERVRELKSAGMNCFEFSGPVSHSWYTGRPYRREQLEEILDYADEQGLLAIPILPDAKALKSRVFEPEVARLYSRRLDKHIRRYGNHASVAMWYMHFNLAGYRWYIPPSKLDGSYKPTNEAFREKERYAIEAQRLAQALDPRPLYHHACGNFGDLHTLNCYIGPTSPLQERGEWPSRWAETRPFPLVACEHGLMLIPYWFRPRQFPLSVVYAGEPIFDELTAKYLGPRAYERITPELFGRYDIDADPRPDRTRALIRAHGGYQEVKSLVARESLRSWRTFGVSGIIFNAVNWDFKDEAGESLPVMRALARYFGDTDLYIAGPEGDWQSKDHSFLAGERVRKQVVLLNDLTHDIPCELEWRLVDGGGEARASGRIDAVSRAGMPTLYPLEFTVPEARQRAEFTLTVEVRDQPGRHFESESLSIEVFPAAAPARTEGQILVFDPVGRTTETLERAGIPHQALTDASDLTRASLVVVGREAYGEAFVDLARSVGLEDAVAGGLDLLIFEQTKGSPLGLRLHEQSARRVFVAQPDHTLLTGLDAPDFINLRGASDLMEPYPEAPPETESQWPARFFKWGNRGTVASFVYRKPHYAPFRPILECGFDLVDSPLLEAQIGQGRIVLCQVDVTPRYGANPVSTTLVNNLLAALTEPGGTDTSPCAYLGASARDLLEPFGVTPTAFDQDRSDLIAIGREPLSDGELTSVERAAERGATVLLLPGAAVTEHFGLELSEQRLFISRPGTDPLLAGLSAGDLYLKRWETISVARPANGWECLVEPGLVATKRVGAGRLISCQLDPSALGGTRGRVKALRVWNSLLSGAGTRRDGFRRFLRPTVAGYEPNESEEMPGYINW